TRYLLSLRVDNDNLLNIRRTTTNGALMGIMTNNGEDTYYTHTGNSSADWFQVVISWDKSSDEFKMYFNGTQVGTTQTGLGDWIGNFSSTNAVIGAYSNTGTNPWSGQI